MLDQRGGRVKGVKGPAVRLHELRDWARSWRTVRLATGKLAFLKTS